jgi:hypothetical protein
MLRYTYIGCNVRSSVRSCSSVCLSVCDFVSATKVCVEILWNPVYKFARLAGVLWQSAQWNASVSCERQRTGGLHGRSLQICGFRYSDSRAWADRFSVTLTVHFASDLGKNTRYRKCSQNVIVWSCVGKWCSANRCVFRGVSEVPCVLPASKCVQFWGKMLYKKFQLVFKICNCAFVLDQSRTR